MEKFEVITAIAAPFVHANVDTDRIIRIERCARVARKDMGLWAFESERFMPDGSSNPEFILNQEPFKNAGILVASENFGCGSSREMAVWAIAGMGIRCVIAPSFGEIFFGNCFQNGLLPIQLPHEAIANLQNSKIEVEFSDLRNSTRLTSNELFDKLNLVPTSLTKNIIKAIAKRKQRMYYNDIYDIDKKLTKYLINIGEV